MKIALGQINTTVGDLAGNVDRMVRSPRGRPPRGGGSCCFSRTLDHRVSAARSGRKAQFSSSAPKRTLQRLARETADLPLALICGYVGSAGRRAGKRATNSAAIVQRGEILLPADQDAAADLRRLRRSPLFRARRDAKSCRRSGRRNGGAHDLRGRLERQAVLGAAALPPRSGRGTRAAPARRS